MILSSCCSIQMKKHTVRWDCGECHGMISSHVKVVTLDLVCYTLEPYLRKYSADLLCFGHADFFPLPTTEWQLAPER